MRCGTHVPRAFAVVVVVFAVVVALAAPGLAQRLRSSSSSLVLATPTVSCGASPQVNLSWSDSASSPTGSYQVMSKATAAKQNSWSAGALLGNVTSVAVSVSNNSSFDFAVRAMTSVTRDSNV